MTYWVYIGLAIIISVGFYYSGFFSTKTEQDLDAGPLALSQSPQLAPTDDAQRFLRGNTGTFQAFFHLVPLQRTGQTTVCNNKPGGDPNCSTDRYDLCECDKNDCTPCNHKSYFNLLNIGNVVKVEVLAVPDAGRPNAAQTQLVLRTTGMTPGATTTRITQETFALPPFPFQKWTFVTISREGRRFDVYYDETLVVSKRAQFSLDTAAGGSPIIAGEARLFGQVMWPMLNASRMSIQDVSRAYKDKTDTTGKPIEKLSTKIFEKLNPCPAGGCLKPVTVRPASPLYNWDTDYD